MGRISQRQINKLSFETKAEIKLCTSGGSGNKLLSFCAETGILYRYVAEGSFYTPDDHNILITGDGGNTRWVSMTSIYGNLDGGSPSSNYGGINSIDCGGII